MLTPGPVLTGSLPAMTIAPMAPEPDAAMIGATIRAARKAKGWSQAELAKRAEPPTTQQQIDRVEAGTPRNMVHWLYRLRRALELNVAALLEGAPIPIRGYVRAGSDEIEYLSAFEGRAGIDEIGLQADDAEALRVRGNSMAPRYFDGEVVLFRESVEPTEYLNRDCVVFLRDGRVMLKRVEAGTRKGHFTLRSYNPAEPVIVDAAVKKLAPVIWVKR